MGMAAAGEWMSFTMSEKRADNHQLSALSLIQIQFSKQLNLDAIHDTVHEMAKDEARHGCAFAGFLKRYFND